MFLFVQRMPANKVSVIITCHNYGRYLEKCIESVLAQTYDHWEVIVVNDGSVDDTLEVMERYKSVVSLISNREALGCGVARNKGLEVASGELCLFLDADDYLESFYLEETVPYLLETSSGIVYCSFYQVSQSDQRLIRALPYHRKELMKENFMAITSLTRTSLVKKVGGFDNRLLLQDYDLWLRITQFCGGVGITEPLFYQTMHDDNMNLTMSMDRRLNEIERIRRRIKHGIFQRYGDITYLVTGAGIRHKISQPVMIQAGLDEKDVFEVERDVLAGFPEGWEISNKVTLRQVSYLENLW